MVAKPSQAYTKLQGNVDKINVRLSSQFFHEHLKLSNVHGKIGKKALNSFCQHFLIHSFSSHLCDPIYRFVHTYYYQIIFGIFFYVHGNIGQNCHFNFHNKESSSQLKFHYREFKTTSTQNQSSSIAKGPN